MKVQYRIENINGYYYPQGRVNKSLFWGRWKRIAKHPTGYGMYTPPNIDYPKTKKECEQIIKGFDKWIKEQSVKNISYTIFTL